MSSSSRIAVGTLACLCMLTGIEIAMAGGPWTGPGAPPLPRWVQSVEILRSDEPLFESPDSRAPRRGTAAHRSRLPLFEAALGPDCDGRWLMVGPMAWVCEDVIRLSRLPALSASPAPPAPPSGLPYQYYFVGENGTLGYRNFSSAEQGYPDAELDPDFVVAVVSLREQVPGDPFGLTTKDLWVPLRDLRPARPTLFQGVEHPTQGQAWVIVDSATAYAQPAGMALKQRYPRFTPVEILESRVVHGAAWSRISGQHWLRQGDLANRTDHPNPIGLKPKERWVDVDLDQQVLTAFEGTRPVFSTLISSGRGTGAAENATPKGEHRLWVKLQTSDMDNLEDPDASRYYAIQSVPWVMYFKRGYGLHGAFWHEDFGRVRSHGCVNLSPMDAYWLFTWTSPRLPTGWSAVFPTPYEQGTLVRVR